MENNTNLDYGQTEIENISLAEPNSYFNQTQLIEKLRLTSQDSVKEEEPSSHNFSQNNPTLDSTFENYEIQSTSNNEKSDCEDLDDDFEIFLKQNHKNDENNIFEKNLESNKEIILAGDFVSSSVQNSDTENDNSIIKTNNNQNVMNSLENLNNQQSGLDHKQFRNSETCLDNDTSDSFIVKNNEKDSDLRLSKVVEGNFSKKIDELFQKYMKEDLTYFPNGKKINYLRERTKTNPKNTGDILSDNENKAKDAINIQITLTNETILDKPKNYNETDDDSNFSFYELKEAKNKIRKERESAKVIDRHLIDEKIFYSQKRDNPVGKNNYYLSTKMKKISDIDRRGNEHSETFKENRTFKAEKLEPKIGFSRNNFKKQTQSQSSLVKGLYCGYKNEQYLKNATSYNSKNKADVKNLFYNGKLKSKIGIKLEKASLLNNKGKLYSSVNFDENFKNLYLNKSREDLSNDLSTNDLIEEAFRKQNYLTYSDYIY